MYDMYDKWTSFKLEKGDCDSRMITITYICESQAKKVAKELCEKLEDWPYYHRGSLDVSVKESNVYICIDRYAYIPNYLRPLICGTEMIVDAF